MCKILLQVFYLSDSELGIKRAKGIEPRFCATLGNRSAQGDEKTVVKHFMDEGGADGFMLAATYTPGCFEEFVDLVVPELQRRGRFRTRYSGSTLRENLLEY
jgi:hypothetical protein